MAKLPEDLIEDAVRVRSQLHGVCDDAHIALSRIDEEGDHDDEAMLNSAATIVLDTIRDLEDAYDELEWLARKCK